MIKTKLFIQYEGQKAFLMYQLKNQFSLGDCSDKFIRKNFIEFKPINDKKFLNINSYCFNYALNTKKIHFVEDSINYILENYRQIKLKNIIKGDIIAFADDYDFLHFGIIYDCTKKNIDNIVIRSKFGRNGIYEHKLSDTPEEFGDRFIIFRKK